MQTEITVGHKPSLTEEKRMERRVEKPVVLRKSQRENKYSKVPFSRCQAVRLRRERD